DKARIGAIAMAGLGMSGKEAADFDWMVTKNNIQNPQAVIDSAANIGQNKNGRFNGGELIDGVYEVLKDWRGPVTESMIADIMTFLQMQSNDTQNVSEAVSNFKDLISDLEDNRQFLKRRVGSDVFEEKEGQLVLKSLQPIIDVISEDTKNGQISGNLWHDQYGTLIGRFSKGGAKTIMSTANQEDIFKSIRNSDGVNVERVALDRSRNFSESIDRKSTRLNSSHV